MIINILLFYKYQVFFLIFFKFIHQSIASKYDVSALQTFLSKMSAHICNMSFSLVLSLEISVS